MAPSHDPTRLAKNEIIILQMLVAAGGRELYAYGMADESEGLLKRTGIYTTLTRMEDKGLISSRKEAAKPGAPGRPKRLYRVTGAGSNLLREHELKAMAFGTKWGLA